MNFIISANTDIGTVKATNQDSLHVKTINTSQGRMVFAIMCDGMGGLAKGEVASATVVKAFMDWSVTSLPALCNAPLEDTVIRAQWEQIITRENERIKAYGASQGVRLGTTVVAMLLTQNRYYILNVGDTRAYEIVSGLRQITDMMAENVNDMSNMNIQYTKLNMQERLVYATMDYEAFADMILGESASMAEAYAQAGIENAVLEKVTVNYLGEERVAIRTSATIQGYPYYILQVFEHDIGQYYVTITFSSLFEDTTQSMLDLFYKLN